MKTFRLTRMVALALLMIMVLTACTGGKPRQFSVVFPNQMGSYNSHKVSQERDPKQMVLFAMRLYDAGKYREAAQFFTEAATIPKLGSEDNEFAISCYSAAATSYLRAGDREGFIASAKNIRRQMNKFQRVTAPETVEVLLALADRFQGANGDLPRGTPLQVSRLFEAGSNGAR